MTYAEAEEALKRGERVSRKAWDGQMSLHVNPLTGSAVMRTFHGPEPSWWKGHLTTEDGEATDWIIVGRPTRFERLLEALE